MGTKLPFRTNVVDEKIYGRGLCKQELLSGIFAKSGRGLRHISPRNFHIEGNTLYFNIVNNFKASPDTGILKHIKKR